MQCPECEGRGGSGPLHLMEVEIDGTSARRVLPERVCLRCQGFGDEATPAEKRRQFRVIGPLGSSDAEEGLPFE